MRSWLSPQRNDHSNYSQKLPILLQTLTRRSNGPNGFQSIFIQVDKSNYFFSNLMIDIWCLGTSRPSLITVAIIHELLNFERQNINNDAGLNCVCAWLCLYELMCTANKYFYLKVAVDKLLNLEIKKLFFSEQRIPEWMNVWNWIHEEQRHWI